MFKSLIHCKKTSSILIWLKICQKVRSCFTMSQSFSMKTRFKLEATIRNYSLCSLDFEYAECLGIWRKFAMHGNVGLFSRKITLNERHRHQLTRTNGNPFQLDKPQCRMLVTHWIYFHQRQLMKCAKSDNWWSVQIHWIHPSEIVAYGTLVTWLNGEQLLLFHSSLVFQKHSISRVCIDL